MLQWMNTFLRISLLLAFLLFSLTGCGGGGGGGTEGGSGAGLGGVPNFSKSTVRINFQQALNLSVQRIATDWDLVWQEMNRPEAVLSQAKVDPSQIVGVNPKIEGALAEELRAKMSASKVRKANLRAIKNKITQYRVIVTAPDLLLPVIAVFPSTATEGSVAVDAGSDRKIRVEGIGVDIDGIEKVLVAAEATVNLTPSITTQLGGAESEVPVQFQEVDSTAPITAIFFSGQGAVEGPHRAAVDIVLSNFEGATLTYRISEVGKDFSTLTAVTSGFQTGVSTKVISLAQEATYLFEYFSTDASGNQEVLNEKQVIVNFNSNPPVSSIDYRGLPYRLIAGAEIRFSIAMQTNETGVVKYTLGNEAQKSTQTLRSNESSKGVTVIADLALNPVNLSFNSEITGGSTELTPQSTQINFTNFLINGSPAVKFEGAANSIFTSGVVTFCDGDSSSIFAIDCDQDTVKDGKLTLMLTGPLTPGSAADFPCIKQTGDTITVVDDGVNGTCQSCNTFKNLTNISCP